MKFLSLSLIAASPMLLSAASTAAEAASAERSVTLTQAPLVMRLNKDEFRIVFGIDGGRCGTRGCSGRIQYRVNWQTPDGTARSEVRHVNYTVLPSAGRTIAVDRQYFDTAEGQNTTDVVRVSVDAITCLDGPGARAAETARL